MGLSLLWVALNYDKDENRAETEGAVANEVHVS